MLGDRQQPSMADYQELRYTMRCVATANVVPLWRMCIVASKVLPPPDKRCCVPQVCKREHAPVPAPAGAAAEVARAGRAARCSPG